MRRVPAIDPGGRDLMFQETHLRYFRLVQRLRTEAIGATVMLNSPHLRLSNIPLCNVLEDVAGIDDPTGESLA